MVVQTAPEINGIFEIHITVTQPCNEQKFIETCKLLQVKPVLIELPYGESPKQLMTSSWTKGNETTAIQTANELANKLRTEGYSVSRVKVEACASNEGVPLHPLYGSKRYFEFHLKINIEDEAVLNDSIAPYHGHLSASSLKSQPNIKFVTLRMYDKGKIEALQILQKLVEEISTTRNTILATHREYAVYDSNINLDAGWVE